jgi:hypothetical protein
MATLLATIRDKARKTLLETTAGFWTEAELLEHLVDGIKDLWGAVCDLHQDHFITVDATLVSMAANTATLSGVPTDVFRVLLIEPRDTSASATGRDLHFIPRKYNSNEAIAARSMSAQEPGATRVVYYSLASAGAPVAAPTVYVQPQLSSALNLRLVYIPTFAAAAYNDPSTDNNPIPGESDNALFAWVIAYARAKERDDRSPDPNWLAVYATEKASLLTRLTPRDESEPEEVVGIFEGFYL